MSVIWHTFSQPERRPSLPPPDRSDASWEDYINSPPAEAPHLGRPVQNKENTKTFKAMIATVSRFNLGQLNTLKCVLSLLMIVKKKSRQQECSTLNIFNTSDHNYFASKMKFYGGKNPEMMPNKFTGTVELGQELL